MIDTMVSEATSSVIKNNKQNTQKNPVTKTGGSTEGPIGNLDLKTNLSNQAGYKSNYELKVILAQASNHIFNLHFGDF